MQVGNEGSGAGSVFGDLLRLQTEFQARLADETLRYLRRLQGVLEPHAPGTVVQGSAEATLAGAAPPGGTLTVAVEVVNRQRVHATLAPSLTPLVSEAGTTWFPGATPQPAYGLVAPGEAQEVTVDLQVPEELPPGRYQGLLVLRGFGAGGLPLRVDVTPPAAGGEDGTPGGDGEAT